MAGERTVKISFTGETTGLDKATQTASKSIGGVSEASDHLATKSGTASGAFGALGSGFQLAGVQSGPALAALGGLQLATDAVSGASDILTLALESQRVKQIGTAIATVASSVAQKAAAVGSAIWTGAQWLLNAALNANPIGLIVLAIIALIAIIEVIVHNTDKFKAVFVAAWHGIKAAALAVGDWFVNTLWKKWILGAWNGITGAGEKAVKWFIDLPGKIKNALVSVASFLLSPFKGAFNAIADAWNNTVGKLHFTVPSWVPGIGGKGFSLPQIPHLARGGMIPATPGGQVIVAGEGGEDEFVIPRSKMGGRGDIYIQIGDREIRDFIVSEIDESDRQKFRSSMAGAGARSSSTRRPR